MSTNNATPTSGGASRRIAEPRRRPRGARPLAVEGLFQSVGQGLGETYLSAFVVWLGGGGLVLGLVGALPTAAAALAQIVPGRAKARASGARAFIARTWVLQAAVMALLGTFALFRSPVAVPLVCTMAALAWFLGGLSVPAWTSLVSQIIPREEHGWFFALRGATQQVGVVTAIVGGGLLLSVADSAGMASLGFLLIFLVAGVSRAIGSIFLCGVPEGTRAIQGLELRFLFDVLRTSAKFRRLAYYLWSLHFATWVASPFFLPYMLRDLGLGYYEVGLLVAVPALVKIITLHYWGRVADRVGPGPLLRSMGWYVLPVSSLWLLSGNVWWIFFAQVYAGLIWGALDLAQASALLQTTRGRERAVALFNLVDGGVMIAGAVIGGLIVMVTDALNEPGFLVAIATSSVLRALPATFLLRHVRGIGKPGWSHLGIPWRLWGVRAARGMTLRPWADLPPLTDEQSTSAAPFDRPPNHAEKARAPTPEYSRGDVA